MLNESFFRTLGLFVQPHIFDEQECSRLRAQARQGNTEHATVVQGADAIVDLDYRSTKRVVLDAVTEPMLIERVEKVRPRLESHFKLTLDHLQPLQLLKYEPGDFFAVHADSSDRPGVPEFLNRRRISVVVFLGHEQVADPNGNGGILQFHGLLDDPRLARRAYPFAPASGTLLAFPSNLQHEVTPVLGGVRYSLVSWFC
jgi:SM-20-related protein